MMPNRPASMKITLQSNSFPNSTSTFIAVQINQISFPILGIRSTLMKPRLSLLIVISLNILAYLSSPGNSKSKSKRDASDKIRRQWQRHPPCCSIGRSTSKKYKENKTQKFCDTSLKQFKIQNELLHYSTHSKF